MLANLDQHAWKFWRIFKRRSICAKIVNLERCRSAQILEISTHAENWVCCCNNRLRHSRERALQSYVFTCSHPPDVEVQRSYIRVYLAACWPYDTINRMTSFHGCTYFFNSVSSSKDDHKRKRQCWRDLSYANTRFTMESIHDASWSRQKTKKNALNPTIAQRRSMHGCCRKQLGQPSKGCAFPTHVSATCWCTRNSVLIQARLDRPRTVGLYTSTAEKETWRPETWEHFCVRAMPSNRRFDYVFLKSISFTNW